MTRTSLSSSWKDAAHNLRSYSQDVCLTLSRYDEPRSPDLTSTDIRRIQKDYLSQLTLLLSSSVAASGAALTFPPINDHPPPPAVPACYLVAFGLGLHGVILSIYLILTMQETSLLPPKRCGSIPLVVPALLGVQSVLTLILGVFIMAYSVSGVPKDASDLAAKWFSVLVLLPLAGAFAVCISIVACSEVHAWQNRKVT